MVFPISAIDASPVAPGSTPAEAIRQTVALAQAAESFGYRRFWVTEHHAMESAGGAAPEILIAAISQRTERIRVGSGGVMLPNWSPLKVAEQFMTLEALAPGRIDLGVGRAFGADLRTARALRSADPTSFPQMLALLEAWLLDAAGVENFAEGHPLFGLRTQPQGPSHPELFVLVSSVDSAAFAGAAGLGMVFAEFIAQNSPVPAIAADAVAAYCEAFRPSPFLAVPLAGYAVNAFAAATEAEAIRLDAPRVAWSLNFAEGRMTRFPTAEAALAEIAARGDDPRLRHIRQQATVGDAAQVADRLKAKMARAAADELFIITFAGGLDDRRESLRLIASSLDSTMASR